MRLISEIRKFLNDYRECVNRITNTLKRLSDAQQMLAQEEISKSVYESLRKEYFEQLLPFIERYFRLKSELRKYKDRLQVLITRLRLEGKGGSVSASLVKQMEIYRSSSRYRFLAPKIAEATEGSPVESEVETQVSYDLTDVEAMLKELVDLEMKIDVIDEVSLLEEYLSYAIKNNINIDKAEWERHLKDVMEKWSERKSSFLNQLENLEAKLSELEDAIRENEIRFAVGEYDHDTYNERRLALERRLNKVKEDIERIQRTIEATDMHILRSMELLGSIRREV